MRKTILTVLLCAMPLVISVSAKEPRPCRISDIAEKTERFRERVFCSGLTVACTVDSICCEGRTVEAWMGISGVDSAAIAEGDEGIWFVSLTKFFRYTAKDAFTVFDDATQYRIIVFETQGEDQRDRYGNIREKRAVPVVSLSMTRKTYDKVNWDYVRQLFDDYLVESMEESLSGSQADFTPYRKKLVAMLDGHWVHSKYLK